MGKKARRARLIPARTTYRVSLDKFLSQKQLWRKSIAKDGSCLFRAVAEQVYLSQNCHQRARLLCAEYIQSHQEDFKEFLTVPMDEYLAMLREGKLWGGEVELVALSKLYGRPLVVYNEQDDSVQEQVFPSVEEDERPTSTDELRDPILLAYCDGNHYDSVYTKDQKSSMTFCQGLVYSILYERVMKDSIPAHCKQRLKSLTENDAIGTPPADDRALQLLRKHYSTEGIVGMAPQLYHNVAMDVYRRERDSIEQRDRRVAASIQFQVGDKCQVRIAEGQMYRGEVSRLDVTPGCHTVYVYESREEWEVPYKDITLPPSANGVPSSARRNTALSQNRPKIQSRPPVSGRTPSHQAPHNPTPRDTQPIRPTPGTSRDTQPLATPKDSQLTHPPPAGSKDFQPSSVTTRDPQPSNPTPAASRETHSTRLPAKSRETAPVYVHPASREAQQTKKTAGQRRETAEGIDNGGSTNQKLRREKKTKEVKKSHVKPTISTPILDNASFPPLPSSKKAPLLATGEVAIGKETVPLQATSVDSPVQSLPGGMVNTSLHKKGATRLQKTAVSIVGGPVTVVPGQVSAPPMKVPLTPPFPNSGVNLTKTPPGPHGSLTSDDSSYSSSGEDSPNGNHPVNATSTNTNQSLVFQYSPFPLPNQLVTGAWEKNSKQPVPAESKRPVRERADQQQHGGISTLQTKEPRTRKGQKSKSDAQWKNNPPRLFEAGVDEQLVGGRESPYLEPQIPRTKASSQPEDAWPMIILENPSPPTLPPLPSPNDTANLDLPIPVMLRSALPPDSPPLIMTSIPAPIPMVATSLTETHVPATIIPTASMIPSPQRTVLQPEPVKVSRTSPSPLRQPEQVKVSRTSPFPLRQPEQVKVSRTSPSPLRQPEQVKVSHTSPSPLRQAQLGKVSHNDDWTQTPTPVHCDQMVQVCPVVLSQPTQTENRGLSKDTQTKFSALRCAIVPVDDLKPPVLTEESSVANLKFIINYAAQCLKAYSKYSGDHVEETLMMVEQFEEMEWPDLLEDVKTASSSSSKEDGSIKLLDSEQQNFIQSLAKPPLLPVRNKRNRQSPKSLKKQTVVASSASEPEQVDNVTMKPGQDSPNHVAHVQQHQHSQTAPAKRSSSKQPTRGQHTKQAKQPPSQSSQEPHSPSHALPSATAATLKQEPPEMEPNDETVEKPPVLETTKKLLVPPSHEKLPEDQEGKGEKGGVHPMEMMAQQEHSMHHYPMPHPQMVMAGARPPGIMMGMPMHPMWPYPPHMGISMVPVYMPPNPFAPQMMPTTAPHMMPNQSLLPEQHQENLEKPDVQEQTTEDTGADSKSVIASESDQVIEPQLVQQAEVSAVEPPQLVDQDISEQGAGEELGAYDQEAIPSETELEQVDEYQEYATDNVDDVQDNVRTQSLPPPEDLSSTLEEPRHGVGSESCSEVEHDSQISTPTSRPATPEDANVLPTLPSLPCRGPSTHTQDSGAPKKGPRRESEKTRKSGKESRVSKTSQPPAAPAGKEESKEAADSKSEPQKEPQKHGNKHQYTSNRKAKGRAAGGRGGVASGAGSGKQSGGGRQPKPMAQDTGPAPARSFNRERKASKTSKYGSSGGGGGGRNTQEPTRGAPYFSYLWDRSTHSILPSTTHPQSFKNTFSLPLTDIDCHDTYSHAQDCSNGGASLWPWPLGDHDMSQGGPTFATLPGHRRDTEFHQNLQTYTQHTNFGLRKQLNSENGTLYRWEAEAHNS